MPASPFPAPPTPRPHSFSFPAAELPLLCIVGAGAASFWRGTWFMMDAALWPDEPRTSCAACVAGGYGGFAALHQGLPRLPWNTMPRAGALAARGCALYAAAVCNVAAWRGTWMAWDLATGTGPGAPPAEPPPAATPSLADERRQLFASGLASHVGGIATLFALGHLTSVLAPPARIGVLGDRAVWASKPAPWLHDLGLFLKRCSK